MDREAQIDKAFEKILSTWGEKSLPQPSEEAIPLLRKAFEGILYKKKLKFLANPPSWPGYKRSDGSIDRLSLEKCLSSVLGRWMQFHQGNGYRGAAMNADFSAKLLENEYQVEGLADNLGTLAMIIIYLRGRNLYAIENWKRALGK